MRRHLTRSGVPVESSKGEWGLGQHEMNIRYAEVLEMADRHVVFKQCLKEIADRQGCRVTFMAKSAADRAGSSCHIHLSLWRDGQQRLRRRRRQLGPVKCSDDVPLVPRRLDRARAGRDGVLRADGELLQALRRRVVGADAARLELRQPHRRLPRRRPRTEPAHRVPDPRRRLQPVPRLCRRRSPPGSTASATGSSRPTCFRATSTPRGSCRASRTASREATDAFAASEFAKRAFGEDVVEHYAHFFRTEQRAFDAAVTDWERRRYFERI